MQSLFQQGEVHGTTHLYIGQEAVATGVCAVLEPQDRVAGTYRGHGHALALGVEPQALLDEMLGRATGVCGGRAGSMNVIDLEHRLIGCFGIIGGSIAAATGAALALKRVDGVAVAFFGDGTTNQGYFHECLNFAKVLRLPVVYVCENNLYGEFTPWEDVTAGQILASPRATLEIPAIGVDGNDVWAVRDVARGRRGRARGGGGPCFVEALTYRFVGPLAQRPRPLPQARRARRVEAARPARSSRAARSAERFDDSGLEDVDAAVEAEIEQIIAAGARRPLPRPRTPAPASSAMPELEFRDAIRDALAEELERDERVIFFGEDVAGRGRRVRHHRAGWRSASGPSAFSTRRSPSWRSPARPSAARSCGLRPVIEIMFGDFMPLAMDSLVNQSAKYFYVSNEQASVPLVVRSAIGAGGRFGAIHSQSPIAWFHGVPGLKIVAPVDAIRRQGAAEGVDPRRQPGAVPRAQAALLAQGGGRRTSRSSSAAPPCAVRATT